MPTELVLEVAAHLSSRPLYCFMKTSRRMHNTLLPELYRELRFMDAEITHSLTCLWNVVRISPNETTACIAMVQSLSLISLRLAEEHIFLPVLQKLLLAMPNLRSLHLHIQMPTESARSEMGIISLTRCAQIFMVLRLTENGHPLVCPLLANISTFDLDTASDLMGSHGITALRIIDALRYADVVTLAYRIGRYSSRTLTALWIRLYEVADMEVAISALTRTLTNLRELSVGQEFILRGNIIEDKAFARSRAVLLRLREDANYLPSLRRLSLWGASTILVSSAERATIRSLLLDIGRVRPMFRYGAVYGVKVEGKGLKTIDGSKKTGTATLADGGTRGTKPDQKKALSFKLFKTQLQEASRQKLSELLGNHDGYRIVAIVAFEDPPIVIRPAFTTSTDASVTAACPRTLKPFHSSFKSDSIEPPFYLRDLGCRLKWLTDTIPWGVSEVANTNLLGVSRNGPRRFPQFNDHRYQGQILHTHKTLNPNRRLCHVTILIRQAITKVGVAHGFLALPILDPLPPIMCLSTTIVYRCGRHRTTTRSCDNSSYMTQSDPRTEKEPVTGVDPVVFA
ncbi:hypothetical protein K474DRAFT_1676507 [Panus rudis PR-1116 ss-1]|nr:hypothetical protein K474DRAFT_1676507 [Panus rudis PR-1116 ss-1]